MSNDNLIAMYLAKHSGALTDSKRSEKDVLILGRELLNKHSLSDWTFGLDNSKARAGVAKYGTKSITVSRLFATRVDLEELRNTILHEIAHALVGHAAGHGPVWKSQAIKIGCSGDRCHTIQFTDPKCVFTCEKGCWFAPRLKRKEYPATVRCQHCSGKMVVLEIGQIKAYQARQTVPVVAVQKDPIGTCDNPTNLNLACTSPCIFAVSRKDVEHLLTEKSTKPTAFDPIQRGLKATDQEIHILVRIGFEYRGVEFFCPFKVWRRHYNLGVKHLGWKSIKKDKQLREYVDWLDAKN